MMKHARPWRGLFLGAVFALLVAAPAQAAEKVLLGVDGLACPFCAYGIEKKLQKTPGVADFTIDINAGTIEVTVEDGARFDEETARRVVRDAGFTLRSFEVVGDGG